MRSNCGTLMSQAGVASLIPALLTRMSSPLKRWAVAARAASTAASSVTSLAAEIRRFLSARFVDVSGYDLRAGRGQTHSDSPADPTGASCPGYERNFSV
jgi:hypothetical protein